MTNRRPTVPLPFVGKRDESGRRLCGLCGTAVPPRRRDWCGQDCVERYLIAKGDQNAARRFLWKRDRGVCAICRTCTLRPEDLDELAKWDRPVNGMSNGVHVWPRGAWEADHALPIVEGGALVRENLRTLCKACHRAETRALRARIAAKRREVVS